MVRPALKPARGPYDRSMGIGIEIAIDGADVTCVDIQSGLAKNRKSLSVLARYLLDQALSTSPIDIGDLFATIKPELSSQLQ